MTPAQIQAITDAKALGGGGEGIGKTAPSGKLGVGPLRGGYAPADTLNRAAGEPAIVPPGLTAEQEKANRAKVAAKQGAGPDTLNKAAGGTTADTLTDQEMLELQTAVKNFRARGDTDAQIRAKLVTYKVPEYVIKQLGL